MTPRIPNGIKGLIIALKSRDGMKYCVRLYSARSFCLSGLAKLSSVACLDVGTASSASRLGPHSSPVAPMSEAIIPIGMCKCSCSSRPKKYATAEKFGIDLGVTGCHDAAGNATDACFAAALEMLIARLH